MRIYSGEPFDSENSRFFYTETRGMICSDNGSHRFSEMMVVVPSARKRRQLLTVFSKRAGDSSDSSGGTTDGTGFIPKILTFPMLIETLYRRLEGSCRSISPVSARWWLVNLLSDTYPDISPGLAFAAASTIMDLRDSGVQSDLIESMPDAVDSHGGTIAEMARSYENMLRQEKRIDPAGMIREILEKLSSGDFGSEKKGYSNGTSIIPWTRMVLDGFLEFTSPELELLAQLQQVTDMVLFWPGDPDRPEIFRFFQAALIQAFPSAQWISNHPAKPCHEGDRTLSAHLYTTGWENHQPEPGLKPSLKMITGRTVRHEIIRLARDIKTYFISSVAAGKNIRLDDICLTFPDVSMYEPLIRRIFHRYGIPVNPGIALPLADSAIAATLRHILEAKPVYSRDRMLALFRDPLISCPGTANIDRMELYRIADKWSRKLKILRGKETWLSRIETARNEAMTSQNSQEYNELSILLEYVISVVNILDGFTEPLNFDDFLCVVRDMLDRFCIRENIECISADLAGIESKHDIDTNLEYGVRAYGRLLEIFDDLAGVPDPSGGRKKEFSTLRNWLFRLIDSESFHLNPESSGRVQVLDMNALQGLTFDRIYAGGLIESAFPVYPPPPVFWSESVRRELMGASDDEPLRKARASVVRIAGSVRDELILSRPEYRDEEHLLPSIIIDDLKCMIETAPVTDDADVDLCEVEAQIKFGASIPDVRNSVEISAPVYRSGIVARCIETLTVSGFPGYSGWLETPAVIDSIVNRFGPSRMLSISTVQTYINCPVLFLFERLLSLEDLREPVEELDPLEQGDLIHDVLKKFYLPRIHDGSGRIKPGQETAACQTIRTLAEEKFESRDCSNPFIRKDLYKFAGDDVFESNSPAMVFARLESELPDSLAPYLLEWGFGRKQDGMGSSELILMSDDGQLVRISGRIDRIDRDGDQAVVYDYKTGKIPLLNDEELVNNIQIGAYMLAVRELLHLDPAAGIYYQVSPRLGVALKPWIARDDQTWLDRYIPKRSKPYKDRVGIDTFLDQIKTRIIRCVSDIRKGVFPASASRCDCSACRFRYLCRLSHLPIDGEEHAETD